MKINIIGSVGVPANYGGFESLIENLLDHNNHNFKYQVFCSKRHYSKRLKHYKNANLIYLNLRANGISSVFYDGLSLFYCIKNKSRIILLLGVSGAIFLPFLKPWLKSKIICNIDGLEWKRSKWNYVTKVFLRYSELIAIKYSDQIISDNKGIADYVLSVYNKESTTIAYGANFNLRTNKAPTEAYGLNKKGYFFKVCRIEPENNIAIILDSFSEIKNERIVIVGNWNNSSFGKKMRNKYCRFSNIFLLDPIYNLHDLNELRTNCKAYIHGHSAGGTNPSLVEAMGLRLPIIAYDVNFNRYTLDNNGTYFSNKNDLIREIKRFDSRDIEMDVEKIHETFLNRYTAEKIAEEYAKLFLKSC